jgi:hypothetical protein
VEKALDYLRDNARAAAQARANRVYMEEFRKTVKAQIMGEYNELANNAQERFALKSEYKPDCRIDCVAIEVAVSQSIIDLREHEPGVSLKLRRKPPIDGE